MYKEQIILGQSKFVEGIYQDVLWVGLFWQIIPFLVSIRSVFQFSNIFGSRMCIDSITLT